MLDKPKRYKDWKTLLQKQRKLKGTEITAHHWLTACIRDNLQEVHPEQSREDLFKRFLHCFHGYTDRYQNCSNPIVNVNRVTGLADRVRWFVEGYDMQVIHLEGSVYAAFCDYNISYTNYYPVAIAMDRDNHRLPSSFLSLYHYLGDRQMIGDMIYDKGKIWNRKKGYRLWKERWLQDKQKDEVHDDTHQN